MPYEGGKDVADQRICDGDAFPKLCQDKWKLASLHQHRRKHQDSKKKTMLLKIWPGWVSERIISCVDASNLHLRQIDGQNCFNCHMAIIDR